MHTLWFIVPAHGRAKLARVCLRQLRRTCDTLTENGIDASAVVVANDENLETARELGFATVRRNNDFLSRKFNDGIQLACDPAFNPRPAQYVVPCGSDDWVDWRLFLTLPARGQIVAFKRGAFVKEDGTEIVSRDVGYAGGVGIRIYPAYLMSLLGYRPADEDRKRACDTSILTRVNAAFRVKHARDPQILYRDQHDYQIVDWKTQGEQLNPFAALARHRINRTTADPFDVLKDLYPQALREIKPLYRAPRRAAA